MLHGWLGSLPVALGAIFVAVFLGVLSALGALSRSGRQRELAGRIERYGPQRRAPVVSNQPVREPDLNRRALDVANRLMSPQAQRRLAERLDLAAVSRKPAEWTLLSVGLGVVIAAALSLATGNVLVGILGGALVGWLGMRLWLSYKIGRRRAAFREQLPDLLQLIASALQSGYSLLQALDAVVREDSQPASGEFSRAMAEARLGGELESCLEAVVRRMDSADLRWTVMAIRIQRSVGGNLGEILTTVAGTMRERGFLRRQVHALSAEGRMSAIILVALPVLVAALMFVVARSYMRPLYTTPLGIAVLVIDCIMVVIGAFWMRAAIRLEV
ncbi:MAG TPA: type II secretion system F family protein [Streptosporangiaceae bacterium]|nr:type II secretion system F family protein [Streptosporangiaceae bacterium]